MKHRNSPLTTWQSRRPGRLRLTILGLALLGFLPASTTEAPSLPFRNFASDDGLAQSVVAGWYNRSLSAEEEVFEKISDQDTL